MASPAPSPGGATSLNSLLTLQLFNQLPSKPEFEITGTPIANGGEGGPWTAKLREVNPPRTFEATHNTKAEAKRIVAEQYLNAFAPGWDRPRPKTQQPLPNEPSKQPTPQPESTRTSKQQLLQTERTADQALYEIEAKGECLVVHPHIQGQFFVGRVTYRDHVFEERVPVEKDHSACKKQVALKLILKLAKAQYALAETFAHQLKPNHFIRGRVMPMEEGTEAEFKGQEDVYGCLLETSHHWGLSLRDVLRNVCGFLNTAGGSLWYGVHDSGLIQGMPLTSQARDKIELKIRTAISHHLQPLSWDYIAVRWHQVEDDPLVPSAPSSSLPSDPAVSSTTSSAASSNGSTVATKPTNAKAAPRPQPPVAPSPADLSKASATVQDRLLYLENLFRREAHRSDLHILEICVLPSRVVHFWDLLAYYRNGNQTVTMPIPMLKNKIRSEPPSNA